MSPTVAEPAATPAAPPVTKPPTPTVRKPPGKMMTALEYAMMVFNDPAADPERRDRMALNALPYQHIRPGDIAKVEAKPKGKKEQRQEIAEEAAVNGIYAVPAGPRLVKAD